MANHKNTEKLDREVEDENFDSMFPDDPEWYKEYQEEFKRLVRVLDSGNPLELTEASPAVLKLKEILEGPKSFLTAEGEDRDYTGDLYWNEEHTRVVYAPYNPHNPLVEAEEVDGLLNRLENRIEHLENIIEREAHRKAGKKRKKERKKKFKTMDAKTKVRIEKLILQRYEDGETEETDPNEDDQPGEERGTYVISPVDTDNFNLPEWIAGVCFEFLLRREVCELNQIKF